eukprot:TRINITY_DN33819_c0_g1_i1.p1 TRINITY_DN33819_c0_g1~~TRINITY_DN33819_c0_g1_i1.p1  ORF type:complete len:526 (-),score=82.04 TRINITY_DN33819_c0_g1_i1:110-1687(-)
MSRQWRDSVRNGGGDGSREWRHHKRLICSNAASALVTTSVIAASTLVAAATATTASPRSMSDACGARGRGDVERQHRLHRAAPWPGGKIPVNSIDGNAAFKRFAGEVFDDLERRTLVQFVRRQGDPESRLRGGGLVLRQAWGAASSKLVGSPGGNYHSSAPSSASVAWQNVSSIVGPAASLPTNLQLPRVELCCFNPYGSRAALRQLSLAVLGALGLTADEISRRNDTSAIIHPSEYDAVNRLYAVEVLPDSSRLPAVVEVGVWQLVHREHDQEDWSDAIGGRGRRVIAGAMHWSLNLADTCQLPGLVGALPTFVFNGNKAEILLLGPESADLVKRESLPHEFAEEGLGAGIRRVTLHARGIIGDRFLGGVPTFMGDGSALLLRSTVAKLAVMRDAGESLAVVLRTHRAAFTLSQVARWAHNQGALLGIPTFLKPTKASPALRDDGTVEDVLEVLLIRPRINSPQQEVSAGSSANARTTHNGFFSAGWLSLSVCAICSCCAFWRYWISRKVFGPELELSRLVDLL